MINHFRTEKHIIPFEKVIYTVVNERKELQVYVEKGLCIYVNISQLCDYIAWLESQQKETITEEHIKKLDELEQVLLNGFNNASQQFGYNEQVNSQENLTGSNHLPESTKMILTKKDIDLITSKICCVHCVHENLPKNDSPCCNCQLKIYESPFLIKESSVSIFNYVLNYALEEK